MRNRVLLITVIAVIALAAAPAFAYAIPFATTKSGVSYDSTLTNAFGLSYAGQAKCVECHGYTEYGNTYHGEFAQPGLRPTPPASWTSFRSAGNATPVAGTAPAVFSQGGSYAVSLPWITLGAFKTAATEYIFFNPGADPAGLSSWNLVEGMVAEPGVGYEISEAATGLYDVKYGCGACHMLGYQDAAADGTVNPNTHITSQPTSKTPSAWAMEPGADKSAFNSWVPGLGIACENCHGTGVAASRDGGGHWNAGVKIVGSPSVGAANSIIDSQVCGQCHGAGGKKVSALSRATIGYTPDQPLQNWLDLYAVSSGVQSYNEIPSEASFTATPSKYRFYPNGANYNLGNHMYYTEWATTGHSYRGQYTSASATTSILPFQKKGNGHFNAKTSSLNCAKCHTGEGYLVRKGAGIMDGFVPSNTNVGFAGQECVTCHTGHPGAEEEGIPGGQPILREPEGSNTSVCEDCHNWQSEVMGTVVTPQATGSRVVSHPTREVYNGRGMFEVPEMGKFMPGVKCEECHAVMANSAMNRPTHSFKIMLPGDAERWDALSGVTVGQDSCSKCHAESRTALQEYIDEWQTEAADLNAALTTEITAAKARSEFATTAGNYLVAVGYTNQAFVNGEGSAGAHNPPYIQAGLEVGLKLAKSVGGSFAHFQGSSKLTVGSMGYVAGTVENGDGSGAADAEILLYKDGVYAGSTRSDMNGSFAFMIAGDTTHSYQAVWKRSSNGATNLSSTAVSVPVVGAVKTASSVSLYASGTSIVSGNALTLSGAVSPNVGTTWVLVQRRKYGSSTWSDLRWVETSSSSNYSSLFRPKVRALYYYRVQFMGTADVAGSTSRTIAIRVR